MASSSNHHQQQIWKYEVFLSFRGEDTRMNFVDHLYTALKQKGIHVFKDDKGLERGEEISPELLKAIEGSRFSIIIFSENYAFSKWCLEELVKIMDCTKQKQTGHRALPIFYNVDPSDVRKQTGTYGEAFVQHDNEQLVKQTGTYGEAFVQHDNEQFVYSIEKIQRWRTALTEASNISGWDSRNRYESELIQEIVEKIFSMLKLGDLLCEDNIVGMDFHMEEMNTLLSKDSNDVKFIGVYGLGGIGKTTIAEAIYNKISCQFEASSFLKNVREKSKQHEGLVNLQGQLLCDILNVPLSELEGDKIGGMIKSRLCNKRVLVILDDVDHIDQLQELARNRHWFGFGSRIIITTRDEHLLDVHGVVERYKVKALDQKKSLELFSWKAFKQNHPVEDFIKLSYDVVNYTKGLPLALKVLGSFLCSRDKTAWSSALDKLEKVPHKEIVQILKITYDGLEETEKKMFLDIACIFKGKDKEYVTNFLDSCGFFAGIGMQVLSDRSLITISDNNEVLMHDLVQDMGWDIVRQECPENPGRRSRLWRNEDICLVLKNNVGTEALEVIVTEDNPKRLYEDERSLRLSSKSFKKMCKLRLLKIYDVEIEIPQGLTNLSDELRILHWQHCPLECLPSTFRPNKLIELKMYYSRIKQLWNGIKFLENLKSVDLSRSIFLTEIPDLTEAPNLEVLILDGATKLFKLHTSVGLLRRLKYLSLRCCWDLSSFPSRIDMESLETLDLYDCINLEKLPSSINNIPKLKVLTLSNCTNLECLPNSICRLKHLEELLLDGCSKLTKLPEKIGDLESLVKLDASRTAIKKVPLSIVLLKKLQRLSFESCRRIISFYSFSVLWSLTYLKLRDCNLSKGMIPDDIGSLSSLETLDLSENMFVELPSSICQLTRLTNLWLVGCKSILKLPELPPSIEIINANDCVSLERLPNPSTEFKKSTKNICFSFVNCFGICRTQPSLSDVVQLFQHQALFGNSETFSLTLPGNDIPEWFSHQNKKKRPSSIVGQLPSNWYNSKLRGLAFCVVAGPPVIIYHAYRVTFGSIGDGLIISNNDSPIEIPYTGYGKLRNDHLVMSYISRAWLREKEKETGMMKTQFYFKSYEARVLKCGIRLVYSEDEDDVVDKKKKAKFHSH